MSTPAPTVMPGADLPPAGELALRAAAVAPPFALLRGLGSSPRGLTESDADARAGTTPDPAPRRPRAGAGPFVPLLAVLGVVFALLGDLRGAVTIAVTVVLSAGLRLALARRARRAVAEVPGSRLATATVRRRAGSAAEPLAREVPVTDLVVGDVVELAAGEAVPADVRLLAGGRLRVDQSALSGEVAAVVKAGSVPPSRRRHLDGTPVLDLPSVAFAGSLVVSGRARAVVLATGPATVLGTAEGAARVPRGRSSADRGVARVGATFLRFMLVLVPLVLGVRGIVSGDAAQAALFALAVAVGLTPELLPAVVTAGLARGATALAGRGAVVARLDALADLGGMDVLCVDKTGTLTSDRVAVAHAIDVDGRLDETALEYAHLVTRFRSGPPDRLDEAVAARVAPAEDVLAAARWTVVDENPFDHERRRASVLLRDGEGTRLLVLRGDPEQVLACCTRARRGTGVVPLTSGLRTLALDAAAAHEEHGLRLLAVAVREPGPLDAGEERDLVLVGFVGLVDPLRDGVADALARLRGDGVAVKVLTGDSPRVAARVARDAGLEVRRVVPGRDVAAAGDATLAALAADADVFAQVTPHQKARIVAALQRRGRCVGVLGDGVNDTAALRAADVGICVAGSSAAARDAADVVLLRPDLGAVALGVREGRRTLGNTMKYVKLTAAANLGNVISVVAASVLLPFLPMLPVQLLVQNLLYDAAQLALPFDRVEEGYLARPRRWDTARLGRFMLVFGLLSSLFDLATFAVLLHLVPPGAGGAAMFRAGWFAEGLVTQVLVLLVLRGRRAGRPAPAVLVAAAAALACALALPLTAWGSALGFAAPPPAFAVWLAAIVAAYLAAAVVLRAVFVRVTGEWL